MGEGFDELVIFLIGSIVVLVWVGLIGLLYLLLRAARALYPTARDAGPIGLFVFWTVLLLTLGGILYFYFGTSLAACG